MILELLQDIKLSCMAISDLQLIDIDRSQLEEPGAHESLLFPCVLVGVPTIDWDQLAHGNQTGNVNFYTKTVVKLPNNTAFYVPVSNSGVENTKALQLTSENLNELLIEDAVHQKLIKLDSVTRIQTKEYALNLEGSEVWVTEHTYERQAHYENVPRYQQKTTETGIGINVILDTNLSQ